MSINQVKLLGKYLDFLVEKNKIITENIANRDSVNYRRKDISFQEYLEKEEIGQLKTTEPQHFKQAFIDTAKLPNMIEQDSYDADDGEINIEKEMANLAKTTLKFEFASKQLGDYFKKLHTVIKGGGF